MKFSLRTIRQFVLLLTLLLLSGGAGWWWRGYKQPSPAAPFRKLLTVDRGLPAGKEDQDMSLFWQVWDRLESGFLFQDQIDEQKMIYGAIKGMTSALGDPYTSFFPPQENQTAKENLNGSFEGVGIQLGYKKYNGIDQLAVISPLTGMPAEKAGVKAGDFILKIIDEKKGVDRETAGISLPEAVELIRGEKGTEVKLVLLAENAEDFETISITRNTIVVPTVEVKFGMITGDKWEENEGGRIAWLKLTRFGGLTDSQWDQAVARIENRGDEVDGVVLDLRNNPGGLLEGAVNFAAEFLPQGSVVVKQEQSRSPTQEYRTERIGRLTKVPLVVLVNQGSASASEIMAAALKELNRAKVVGKTTFGKGTIQEAEDLTEGAGLHLTIARWVTPNGVWLNEKGLEPDLVVEPDQENPDIDKQLVEAAKLLT